MQYDQMSNQSKAMVNEAFQQGVYIQGVMDVQHDTIYDTVTIAANAAVSQTTASFFTTVGPSSGKTIAQTNMEQTSLLPAPQAFSIFSIQLRFAEDILLADLLTLYNSFCLAFYMGQKAYQRRPLWQFLSGGGVSGFTTSNNTQWLTNGEPSREAILNLAIPIVIANQQNFYARFEGTQQTLTAAASGGTGMTATLTLDGLYARGVQ